MKFFKKRYDGLKSIMSGTAIEALRELMESETEVVKISPKGYKLSNGVDYCSVGLRSIKGEYLLHAYGKEAIELHDRASFMVEKPIMLVPHSK